MQLVALDIGKGGSGPKARRHGQAELENVAGVVKYAALTFMPLSAMSVFLLATVLRLGSLDAQLGSGALRSSSDCRLTFSFVASALPMPAGLRCGETPKVKSRMS